MNPQYSVKGRTVMKNTSDSIRRKRDNAINSLRYMANRLSASKKHDHSFWVSWVDAIINALEMEERFPYDFQEAGKPILNAIDNIDHLIDASTSKRRKIIRWLDRVYDVYHPLRNNVETMDSIESVRVYLKSEL